MNILNIAKYGKINKILSYSNNHKGTILLMSSKIKIAFIIHKIFNISSF
jgi:hypothetical protein